MGMDLGGLYLYTLQIPDNQVVIVNDKQDLQHIYSSEITREIQKVGLQTTNKQNKYLPTAADMSNMSLDVGIMKAYGKYTYK